MARLIERKSSLQVLLFCLACILTACTQDIVMGGNSTSTDTDDTTSDVDTDGDGLSNSVEGEIGTKSATADTDQDGFSDGLEFVVDSGEPLDASTLPSPLYQSKTLSMADAVTNDTDSDGDGLGDTYENSEGLDSTAADSDSDGYSDGLEEVAGTDGLDAESFPERSSKLVSDGVSRTTSGAPTDSDQDGMSDVLETRISTSTTIADTDGDGFSDAIEYVMGSDPNDYLSIPSF